MGDRLFDREIALNVNGIRIASRLFDTTRARLGLREKEVSPILKVAFKVTKTLKKEPNKAEISIHNLRPENRQRLQVKNVPVVLEAGYVDNVSQIFSGNLEFGNNTLSGTDWVTTIQSGDGSKNFKSARINTSLKAPVKIKDALKTAAAALGVNVGNLDKTTSSRANLTEFVSGLVLSGKAELELDKVAKSMGLSWSIQDGHLLFLGPNEYLGEVATILSSGTGMVGSPESGEKGIIKVRSLLQPELLPGRRVQIVAKQIEGFFRIEKSVFVGDTWGNDWYTELECKPI